MGPTSEMQMAPMQKRQHESLVCCVVQESSEEENNEGKNEEVMAKKEVQVTIEEEMEEVDLGSVS